MTAEDALVWARFAALLGIAASWLFGGYFLTRMVLGLEEVTPRENLRGFFRGFIGFCVFIALFAAARVIAVKLGYEPL